MFPEPTVVRPQDQYVMSHITIDNTNWDENVQASGIFDEVTCSNMVPTYASVSALCGQIVATQLLLPPAASPPAASSVSPRCNTYRFANAIFLICNTDTTHSHQFTAQRRTCYRIYNEFRNRNKGGYVKYTGPNGISSLYQDVDISRISMYTARLDSVILLYASQSSITHQLLQTPHLLRKRSGTSSPIAKVIIEVLWFNTLSALILPFSLLSANSMRYCRRTVVSAATNSTCENFFPRHARNPSLNGI